MKSDCYSMRGVIDYLKKKMRKNMEHDLRVPTQDKKYVPWGHHEMLSKIIESQKFFPVFISGLSGNGKTFMVEQICAEQGRECTRVNITCETDEDDLIGGFRLVDGDTVWHYGPVIETMQRGGVLLLDEIDLASNRIMCLQPVFEGKGIYIKKINEKIEPKQGFTIIATANTKGQGDDDGKFIGTNILNEAFLDRFALTIEQTYAPREIELKMLEKRLEHRKGNERFLEALVDWAENIRKGYDNQSFQEVITTRRLIHIVETFNVFGDHKQSVQSCLRRFDADTQSSFYTIFEKVFDLNEKPTFNEGITDDDSIDLENASLF